jgi:hypothetical protein
MRSPHVTDYNIGCSERRLIWHSFYRWNFPRKSCATCREKSCSAASRTEKSDKPKAAFFSASGAALLQEVPKVNWMSNQPALWTPGIFSICLAQTSTDTGQGAILWWLPLERQPGKCLSAPFTTWWMSLGIEFDIVTHMATARQRLGKQVPQVTLSTSIAR